MENGYLRGFFRYKKFSMNQEAGKWIMVACDSSLELASHHMGPMRVDLPV
jgi:hypothetical protein